MNIHIRLFAIAGFMLMVVSSCAIHHLKNPPVEVWTFDSLFHVNGYPVEVFGNPNIINSTSQHHNWGKAVSFDGDGDRLLVEANPLGDAIEFTIEIVFKPNDSFPNNKEPRFFHIEAPDNPNRRITIELRLNDQHQWYLDAYIKSETSQFTLIDATKVHPTGRWAHAAITYKNREFISYVNGKKELTGTVDYLPIPEHAKTSIGSRMNQIHWFNGEILQVGVSKKALNPKDFKLRKILEATK